LLVGSKNLTKGKHTCVFAHEFHLISSTFRTFEFKTKDELSVEDYDLDAT
jgi:hypothetical protein